MARVTSGYVDTPVVDKAANKELEELQATFSGISALVRDRFSEAETSRNATEIRWLQAYEDFRGTYSEGVQFRDTEKSRVFVKIAKTKTLAAYGQLVEVIFAGNKFPIGIVPTEKPFGIAEEAHLAGPKEEGGSSLIPEGMDVGFPGDGRSNADPILGGLKSLYKSLPFISGKNPDSKGATIDPAKEAAENMETVIRDQLTESHASRELREALLQSALYGTGIIKGPFSYDKVVNNWSIEVSEEDKEDIRKVYKPTTVNVPRIEFVSVWDFFPDPAANCIEDCEYVIQRHKLNRSQLRDLAKRPYFNHEALRICLKRGPNWVDIGHEELISDTDHDYAEQTRWEVLEYWGVMDAALAVEAGFELDTDKIDPLQEVQVNVWICNDQVLRFVVNPFEPERIPYHAFPYEKNPNEFFGIGVPENMADSTQIMNGHARMAIDNLALSGHVILDVDENSLVDGQSSDIFPGKVFRRVGGQAGQAIFPIKIPNTTQANMEMFDKFRQLADEATGIPSYSHGSTGAQGMTRTASGMSMLMGAASLSTKTVVKNLDDYLLKPLGEGMFFWNMQFNLDAKIVGDLDVKALGTEAIMQKEVRSQRLTQFAQVAFSNPILAALANGEYILEEIGKSLDLDADRLVNGPAEAKLQAELMQASGAGPAMGMGATTMAAGSSGTGDGTIGTGMAAQPGEDEFSANTGYGEQTE